MATLGVQASPKGTRELLRDLEAEIKQPLQQMLSESPPHPCHSFFQDNLLSANTCEST